MLRHRVSLWLGGYNGGRPAQWSGLIVQDIPLMAANERGGGSGQGGREGDVWKGSRPRSEETCGRDLDRKGRDLGRGYCKEEVSRI